MATRQELFHKGEAVRQQLQHGSHGSTGGGVTDTVPGLRRVTTEAGFGAVWARPGMDMRYRMICTLSVLSVLQRLSQLRIYIHSALNIGIEPRAIQEVFIQAGIGQRDLRSARYCRTRRDHCRSQSGGAGSAGKSHTSGTARGAWPAGLHSPRRIGS